MIAFVIDDGGRALSGFRGSAGDCVTRAVAIASGLPYDQVYDDLAALNKAQRYGKRMRSTNKGKRSARNGVFTNREPFKRYMRELGFVWTPTMVIGSGCRVHVRADELPSTGRHVLVLSKHCAAYVDGVLRDTYDCSRDGTRAVYGYWTKR